MKVLVTGGAGYIGSIVVEALIAGGHSVTVLDNLKYGHREAVPNAASFVEGDLLDITLIRDLILSERPDAVAHLAAEAYIDLSISDPGQFYRTNLVGSIGLLDAMASAGVKRMVFSSTAAVYGSGGVVPLTEDAPLAPCNAYGDTKLAVERALPWYRNAHGLCYAGLRFFNACGATTQRGEDRKKETHLIPICFDVITGKRDALHLFGTDYETPDGTCIRDYVHVIDIAQAHLLALEQLNRMGAGMYNVGLGRGYSNRDVIDSVERVTGKKICVVDSPPRAGDPAVLVADTARIRRDLGWRPECAELDDIVSSAWEWRVRHPNGYSSEGAQ